MGKEKDLNKLKEEYSEFSNNELLNMFYFEKNKHSAEDLYIINKILQEKGLTNPTKETLEKAKQNYQKERKERITAKQEKTKKEKEDNTTTNLQSKMCPFCAEEIKIDAIKCKHCGEFLDKEREKSVQIIEQTSKQWKGLQLISVLICTVGVFMAYGAKPALGILIIFGGIFVFCLARIGAWWHHG